MGEAASPTSHVQAAEHELDAPFFRASQSTSEPCRKPYGKPLGKTKSSMLRLVRQLLGEARVPPAGRYRASSSVLVHGPPGSRTLLIDVRRQPEGPTLDRAPGGKLG